ncbi:hypothetical protein LCGC14_1720900 [marine sediment metagenome]|uniref:Uncharacterized protein n=1 Tax=marine sediment metagenome TaxID=412755 RepID=A0A0F9I060_9ZZZZ
MIMLRPEYHRCHLDSHFINYLPGRGVMRYMD